MKKNFKIKWSLWTIPGLRVIFSYQRILAGTERNLFYLFIWRQTCINYPQIETLHILGRRIAFYVMGWKAQFADLCLMCHCDYFLIPFVYSYSELKDLRLSLRICVVLLSCNRFGNLEKPAPYLNVYEKSRLELAEKFLGSLTFGHL